MTKPAAFYAIHQAVLVDHMPGDEIQSVNLWERFLDVAVNFLHRTGLLMCAVVRHRSDLDPAFRSGNY